MPKAAESRSSLPFYFAAHCHMQQSSSATQMTYLAYIPIFQWPKAVDAPRQQSSEVVFSILSQPQLEYIALRFFF